MIIKPVKLGQIYKQVQQKILQYIGIPHMSELYQVEKIIGKRISAKGKTQYNVKWVGYSQSESTWQPSENLVYVRQLIKEYEANLRNGTNEGSNEQDEGQLIQNEGYIQQQSINFDKNSEEDQNEVVQQEQQEGEPKKTQVVQFQESDYQKGNKAEKYQNQKQKNQKQSEDISNESVFQTKSVDDESYSDESRPRKKKKTKKNKMTNKTPKRRKGQFLNSQLQNLAPQKKLKMDRPFQPQNQQNKYAIKSPLQKIEEKMRYNTKSKDKSVEQRRDLTNVKPKVMGLNYNDAKQVMYMTQVQGLVSYKPREYMIDNWPDELIKFYENMIDFKDIPKVSR